MTAEVWVPREDQRRALELWGDRRRGAIWSGCGSGKTVMAGTILADWMLDRCEIERALIVAPPLVVEQWPAEFARWQHTAPLAPLTGIIRFEDLDLTPAVQDNGRRGGLVFRNKAATRRRLSDLAAEFRVLVCSWHALPFVEQAFDKLWPFEAFVIDESSNLKDPTSKRTKAARRAVHKSGKVQIVLELTATPRANRDEALWAQLDLLDPGCLGPNVTAFRERWCVPDKIDRHTGRVHRYAVAPAFRPVLDMAIARLAVRVPDNLGVEIVVSPRYLTPPDSVREEMRALTMDRVLDDVTAGNAAVLHAKLRQMAAGGVYADALNERGPVRWLHDLKYEHLDQILEELEDEPVVVLYNWEFERRKMEARYGARRFRDIRDGDAKGAFEAGKLRMLGLHPASAGHGVDGLQRRCHHAVWLSVPEDRELFDQANGRLRRGGQVKDTVFVHVLVAAGTREETVWREALPDKAVAQASVLAAAAA